MTGRRILLLLVFLAAASAMFGQVNITSLSPLPQGFAQIPYTYTFTAATFPSNQVVAWSVPDTSLANLPAGFTLSANGTLSGTTTQYGTFSFQVTATFGSFSATQTFSVTLLNPFINITTSTFLANGFVSQFYSLTLAAMSSPTGLTWFVSGGTSLPPGLNLTTAGLLSGIPTTPGKYDFVVTAQIAGSNVSTNQQFTLTVYTGQTIIQTSSLPFAFTGQPYMTTLSGFPGAVTWTLTGMLPSGIIFDPATGILSGTTSAVGSYLLQFQASYLNYLSATRTLTLYVTKGVLTIPQTVIAPAVQGSPYQTTVVASGGLPPYVWGLAAANTVNLTINAQTGVLSGTPPAAGNFLVPISLSDATGQAVQANLSLSVGTPLAVATASLPNGTVGAAYSQALSAGGGQSPFTWILVNGSGSLPSGLTLSSSGVIGGTPTADGTFHFTVQVTDVGGRTATAALGISVGVTAALTITTSSLPNGLLSVPYSQTMAVTGGVAPYTWALASGALPQGLSLNNGKISGTPLGPLGVTGFTVQVTDSSPPPALTAQRAFTINITLTLTITTLTLPGGTLGLPYSQTLAGSGGTAPYTWSVASGSLPPGLQLNPATGAISGTPTATGPSVFFVMLTDSAGLTAQQQLAILIGSLSITSGSTFSATAGTAFSQTLTAANGTPPYAWSIASGALPAGLQLNLTSGAVSGTPTAAGTSNVTVKVTDSKNLTATAAISITVTLPPLSAVTIGTIAGNAATQPAVGLSLGSAFPAAVAGTLSVGFQSAAGGNPSEVQFITSAGGSSSVSFSIAAGATQAIFSGSPVLATGTVAGTITLTAALNSGGVNITPTPAPAETIVIAPSAPVIQSVAFSNTGGALTVTVVGYSTTREMVSGQFTFAPASGSTLSQSTVTVQLGTPFSTWYQSSASNQYGGQFKLTVPFSVTGTSAGVASVSVTLTNTKGASLAAAPH
jgi:hypothetical protein